MMPHEDRLEKTKALQEIKENSDLVQFVKSLTKEEIERIKETREFETIKPLTPTWKVALLNDTVRANIRLCKSKLAKRMMTAHDLQNNIRRLNDQLHGPEIIEEVKPGLKMNKAELASLIQQNQWLLQGEIDAIPRTLAELRGWIAHKDVAKKVVMTVEEYDKYVDEIEAEVEREFGVKIFEELEVVR